MDNYAQPIALSTAGKKILQYFLFVIWLLFTVLPVQAQNTAPAPIEITSEFTERKIGRDISIFEDPSGQLTFDQVRTPEMAAQFVTSTKESPSFGFTRSAYWANFALEIERPSKHEVSHDVLYLKMAHANTDLAELWCTDVNGKIVVLQRAGDHVPRGEWSTSYRQPTFKISHTSESCWLRVQSNTSIQFPLTLYSEEAFFNMRLFDNALQALYFGALIVMLIYNGLIAVTTRSPAYLSYTAFLLSFGLYQFTLSGLGYNLLWHNTIRFNDYIFLMLISLVGISALLFSSALIELKIVAPRWFKLYFYLVTVLCVSLLFPWLFSYSFTINTFNLLLPIGVVIMLGSVIYLSLKGIRIAKIFLIAWFFLLLGVIIDVSVSLGFLQPNSFTSNAIQIGSAIEFILLSFALADRIKTTQANLLNAQKKIAEGLRLSEQELTQKVEQRTVELKAANQIAEHERDLAMTAKALAEREHQQAETARQQAETARHETAQALDELKATQTQLIAAEKMASLGLLVSNVAHEINTPIGAVKSSGTLISDTLDSALPDLSKLFAMLDDTHRALFVQLITQCKQSTAKISTREERALTKQLTTQLLDVGVEDASRNARFLMKLRAHQNPLEYLPLLQHPDNEFILDTAGNMANIINGTSNINSAVEKVSRVVYALKALSGDDVVKAAIVAPLQPDMDKALAKYQSQMHSVELVTNFQSDMPVIHADHDAMEQLCIHLVLNALQAMNYEGKLTVGLAAENNQAIISVTDTGTGIADDIKNRIFEPFFTTRTSGEGSGMGLAIVKRIVEQHQGSIGVQTEVGVGTTFTVKLPYKT